MDNPTPPRGCADDPLAPLRLRIDALDEQLIALISERGRLAAEIGRIKAELGAPVYSPDREHVVYQRVRERNPGPFPERTLLAVYRELMSGSLLLERPLRIAYLGPPGSFSHRAATGKFGASVECEPVTSIAAVFDEVQRAHADFGVVPIENSLGGGISDTLDALADTRVQICGEILNFIHHHLLARRPLHEVERVYSKPEVFEQCKLWLVETGLISKTAPVASTSRAAEMAAADDRAAAIGSALAAEIYGLPIMVEHVEDSPNNVTRFFVIGRDSAKPTGDDKSALLFATTHEAGALASVLDVFRQQGVSLTMITSRPSRLGPFQYRFFVDCEGHASDPALASALERVRSYCSDLRVLGSFPRAAAAT